MAVKPIVGVLEGSAKLFRGVENAARMDKVQPTFPLRLPRVLGAHLCAYDRTQAAGADLTRSLGFKSEDYVVHCFVKEMVNNHHVVLLLLKDWLIGSVGLRGGKGLLRGGKAGEFTHTFSIPRSAITSWELVDDTLCVGIGQDLFSVSCYSREDLDAFYSAGLGEEFLRVDSYSRLDVLDESYFEYLSSHEEDSSQRGEEYQEGQDLRRLEDSLRNSGSSQRGITPQTTSLSTSPCLLSPTQAIDLKDLFVTVQNYSIHGFVEYEIGVNQRVEGGGYMQLWMVHRRFSAVYALRKSFIKRLQLSTSSIPFPSKHLFRLSASQCQARMEGMETALQCILSTGLMSPNERAFFLPDE